jgi:hypothetical protein
VIPAVSEELNNIQKNENNAKNQRAMDIKRATQSPNETAAANAKSWRAMDIKRKQQDTLEKSQIATAKKKVKEDKKRREREIDYFITTEAELEDFLADA